MRRLSPLFMILLAACATAPPLPQPAVPSAAVQPCNAGHALVNSALWVQSAQEYRAVALGTYASAQRMLDAALSDPSWTAPLEQPSAPPSLPPAVILDVDETSSLNLPFEARAIKKGVTYDAGLWKEWVSESAALEVPGARDFLLYARSRGVTPFYITNRRAAEEAPTRRNLEKLGYPLEAPVDTLLVRAEKPEWDVGDKSSRRAWVASQYRVLLLLGDDLNDFTHAAGKTMTERDEIMRATAARWGTKWFMLPNPMYGSWERAVTGGGPECEALQKKIDALRDR